jgi:hypothetical protein
VTPQRTKLTMNYRKRLATLSRPDDLRVGFSTYPANGKHVVVSVDLLSALVSTSEESDEDNNTSRQGHTRHCKDQLLRPGIGTLSPGWEAALGSKSLASIEDSKG